MSSNPFRIQHLWLILVIFSINAHSSYLDYIYQDKSPSFNNFGQTGLIQLPTAESLAEGSLYVTFTRNDIYKFGAMTISPFDWLEGSYFYYRPYDVYWFFDPTEAAKGLFLDKGFNIKFKYKPNKDYLPSDIAIGLDDFAGTGLFSKQYVVGTHDFGSLKATFGFGTGLFSAEAEYTIANNELFGDLGNFGFNSSRYSKGGDLTYDLWFRGERSFFGGIEYTIPYSKGITLKVEKDPFNYFAFLSPLYGLAPEAKFLRQKDSDYNFALNIPFFDSSSVQLYYFKGNTFGFTFSIGANFNKGFFKKEKISTKAVHISKSSNQKKSFYEDLLFNLNSKNLFVQSAEIKDKSLKVAIAQATYNNPVQGSELVAEISKNVSKINNLDIENIEITNVNANLEMNRVTFLKDYFEYPSSAYNYLKKSKISFESGNKTEYLQNEFKPRLTFPRQTFGWTPVILNHIGDPIKFYHGGLILRLDHDIAFSRRLTLNSQYATTIFNNFDEKRYSPRSELEHVRTDIVKYLQESDNYIPRMQMNYIWSPYQNIYAKLSGGLLEQMYGGVGGEVLYKPFNRNYSVGIELYKLQQRSYDQLFEFREYKPLTGHINFATVLYPLNIVTKLSIGQYLAGDRGYTFDISRKTKSGFRAGFFFTRTNVSAELFGEGSFDKGFYFQLPIDTFLNRKRSGNLNFKLRPLTRDGGQKLQQGSDLIGIIYNSSYDEIAESFYEKNN